jgi:uncharacterized protein YfaS (alpha-2-macroglobulin family)
MNHKGLRATRFAGAAAGLAVVALGAVSQPRPPTTWAGINPLETRLLGQTTWLAGGPASLRVIVADHNTGQPVPARVQLSLSREKPSLSARSIFEGRIGRSGTLDASFQVPDLEPGQYKLEARVNTPLGMDSVTQSVSLARRAQVLLVTDKPIYQPGQVIHMRALALRQPALKPEGGQSATLEVEDSKGNNVFKKRLQTSKFGVVSADFQLADEINLGTYTVRAILEYGQAEKKVNVERYVLPKFKVTLSTERAWYLPGQEVSGKLQADYFFGKPVAAGKVLLTFSAFDVKWSEFAQVTGKTDEEGFYRFSEVKLPEYLVGLPLEQGKALVKIDAEVTDRADHTEKAVKSLPVASEPIQVTVVPESRDIRPGVENRIYIVASSPDGTPARAARVLVKATGEGVFSGETSAVTDDLGIATYRLRWERRPERAGSVQLAVNVASGAQSAQKTVSLQMSPGRESLLLRADRALAKVGEQVRLTVLTTKPTGTVYLDAIKDRQTVLTRSIELEGGRAAMDFPLTPELAGTVELHAYQILPDENIIRDTRIIMVSHADDLTIEVRPDQKTYRPGGDAAVEFTVRDAQKHPVLAALGISVVDEAVFGLQEMQPGLEKIYFMLERELLQPRYEIHGLSIPSVVKGELPVEEARPAGNLRQEAARVLFAAVPPLTQFSLRANSYADRAAKARAEWERRMRQDAKKIDQALARYQQRHGNWLAPGDNVDPLLDEGLLLRKDLLDQWGHPYRIRHWGPNAALSSAGPDGRWGTVDDIVQVMQWERGQVGGGFGGFAEGAGDVRMMDRVAALRMAAPAGALLALEAMSAPAKAVAEKAAPAGPEPPRIREYFPETMLWEPALITDDQGRATLKMKMADSITTWRLTALANSLNGRLGSATAGLRVFQDFFVDLDLPVALTQNDEVAIPVAVYNYMSGPQTVRLKLEKEPWFELMGEAEQSFQMKANDVAAAYFRIKVKGIGRHKLTVMAYGSKLSDAIRREIEVLPDGKEVRDTWNDRLEKTVAKAVTIPAQSIEGASTILVKIYPGIFSQAVEGLDSLLRMPFGCFEQTSSVTYPNVLVLDYLKRTKKVNPEIQMKAEGFINVGYQRLLSYEVKGGGFSWFGNAPAHKVLTAYGLMEFHDMSKVHEVDPNVIARTQQWLVSQQNPDGTWPRDEGGIAEGIINRQTDVDRVTAYIAWALAETGYRGEALDKALRHVRSVLAKQDDAYVVAVMANALITTDKNDPDAVAAVDKLAGMAVVEGKIAYWKSSVPTMTFAEGGKADLESTGLAAYTLLKSGRHSDLANKAITYLIQSKDSFGTWSTTQATVWALKGLMLALEKATEEISAAVSVSLNGKEAGSFRITPEDSDVMRQLDLRELVQAGENRVEISFSGKGSALYQIVAKYYLPWEKVLPQEEALRITVDYDRTRLAKDDAATASVTVVNQTGRVANMVIVDLGLPPGFEVDAETLQTLVGKKVMQKFTVAARQIICYFEKIEPGAPLEFSYRLRAKFPVKAQAPRSRAYLYYNPEVEAAAKPVEMTVE